MTLEQEIAEMRAKLDYLEEKVRLKRVVEAFPRMLIRPGDCFMDSDGTVVLFMEITSDGKGIFSNGRRQWESVVEHVLKDGERLYTQTEVEAIVGRVKSP